MNTVDLITDLHMRPGYPFAGDDRAIVRAMIQAQLDSGRFVLWQDGAGNFQGFMSWIRTDEFGAAMIREFGISCLAYLAMPIPVDGPGLVILFDVIAPSAPRDTLAAIYKAIRGLNSDAQWLATYLNTRRGDRWIFRGLA